MTVVELDEHRKTATEKLIDVALRLERDDNVDHWELADTTLEAVEERMSDVKSTSYHTGSGAILDEIRWELREAGATNVATKATLRGAYRTALAWPPDERIEGANYWAHFELAASTWQNRKRILQRLVDDHRHNGRKGLIGTPEVRLRKTQDIKPDLRPRDAKLDAALRNILRRWASPQSFAQLAADEQDTAVRILEGLANEIRSGNLT